MIYSLALQENSLKKKLSKKKVKVKIKKGSPSRGVNEDEVEDTEGNEAEQDHHSQKDKASSALLPPKRRKMKRKAKVKEENSGPPESPNSEVSKPRGTETLVSLKLKYCILFAFMLLNYLFTGKEERVRKKKTVQAKRKNKINTEEVPASYAQPVDLSATFGKEQWPL